jgi:RNA polymerase sigma-70 factor, ECF subfamily
MGCHHCPHSARAVVIGTAHRRVDQYRNEDGVLTGHTLDDATLVARVARGEEEALGQLYDRFGQAVYSLCLRVVRDGATAEELTQEVFVRLWRSAASFELARGQVSTWLLRIAHNLALNELRRRQSRPVVASAADWEVASAELADTSGASDPSLVADLRERAEMVHQALRQLPVPQRQAIELAFFGGLSQTEVAAALGAPLGTVKSRIRLGMQRLRELLVAAGIDEA